MNTTTNPNRELALTFYRANLHGTGWKVETGAFDTAIDMLDDYIKSAKKAGDLTFLAALRGLRAKVQQHKKTTLRTAA